MPREMLILFSEKGAEAGMFKIWIAGTIVSVILSRANRFVHLKHSGDPWTGDEEPAHVIQPLLA